MTEFGAVMPVLRVTDLDRSLAWYAGLGFALVWREPADGGGENAMLAAGPVRLLLSTGAHLGGAPAFTGTLYFDVRGVDELWLRAEGRSTVVWPLEDQEYGTREFGVRDPDGYLLAFAEGRG